MGRWDYDKFWDKKDKTVQKVVTYTLWEITNCTFYVRHNNINITI